MRYVQHCDTVGMLLHLLEHIPEDAFLRVNGKKAVYSEDANAYTIYLDSAEDETDTLYGF